MTDGMAEGRSGVRWAGWGQAWAGGGRVRQALMGGRRTARVVGVVAVLLAGVAIRAEAQSEPRLVAAVKLAQEGQGDSARATLDRMLEATPTSDSLYPQILYTLGMVADNTEDRQRMFQRVVIEYSNSTWADEALFRLAQVAYAASDWPTAIRYLDRVRADFPGSPLLGYAALYGARAQFQAGDAAAACGWISDGLARDGEPELRQALEAERRRCTGTGAAAPVSAPADRTPAQPSAPATGSTAAAASAAYRVQIAAVGSRAAADELVAKLREMNVDGLVVQDGGLFKVRAGSYATRGDAERAVAALQARFGGRPFIVAVN